MASPRKTNQATTKDSQSSLQQAQKNSVECESFKAPWKLYPIDSYNELRTKHGKENIKVIHMVRHAEGTHNVDGDYKNEKNMDARLTENGMAQCQSLAQHTQATMTEEILQDIDDVAVITSPMTRCVQTALYSFRWLPDNDDDDSSGKKVPFVALESIRETVNYACDRRRTIAEISKDFPRVDFTKCDQDNDFIWDDYRNRLGKDWDEHMESGELNMIAHRAREGFEYLQGRPEHHLVVCSHSAFLRCILNWGQEEGVPQMPPQVLDKRQDKTNYKLFKFCGSKAGWEDQMRSNYENCELRSFCMLAQGL
ncbi:unnamed protein product [Cylindrotheca closterium]|uniref:Phosphoglycerate mutase-like protein n=1 Tax=Cylindrotheca closterium TaxID=2856 RepID=A0AAD2FIQ4_9STRA|nr:unnamed protein product [Cylindrotheca closterium]